MALGSCSSPGIEVIIELSSRDDVLTLADSHEHTSDTIRSSNLFIKQRKKLRRLLIRPDAMSDYVQDVNTFLARSDIRANLVRDGKHLTTNCRLERGRPPERLFCFKLPEVGAG